MTRTPHQRAADVAALHASAHAHDHRGDVSRAELVAFLRGMAYAGNMPLQRHYNDARPYGWPTAGQLVRRMGTAWGDLADAAGLAYAPYRGRG